MNYSEIIKKEYLTVEEAEFCISVNPSVTPDLHDLRDGKFLNLRVYTEFGQSKDGDFDDWGWASNNLPLDVAINLAWEEVLEDWERQEQNLSSNELYLEWLEDKVACERYGGRLIA